MFQLVTPADIVTVLSSVSATCLPASAHQPGVCQPDGATEPGRDEGGGERGGHGGARHAGGGGGREWSGSCRYRTGEQVGSRSRSRSRSRIIQVTSAQFIPWPSPSISEPDQGGEEGECSGLTERLLKHIFKTLMASERKHDLK